MVLIGLHTNHTNPEDPESLPMLASFLAGKEGLPHTSAYSIPFPHFPAAALCLSLLIAHSRVQSLKWATTKKNPLLSHHREKGRGSVWLTREQSPFSGLPTGTHIVQPALALPTNYTSTAIRTPSWRFCFAFLPLMGPLMGWVRWFCNPFWASLLLRTEIGTTRLCRQARLDYIFHRIREQDRAACGLRCLHRSKSFSTTGGCYLCIWAC